MVALLLMSMEKIQPPLSATKLLGLSLFLGNSLDVNPFFLINLDVNPNSIYRDNQRRSARKAYLRKKLLAVLYEQESRTFTT